MTRKKSTPNEEPKSSTKVPFKGYINISLTDDEKEKFEYARQDPQLYTAIYAEMLRSGYNVSVKWLPSEKCFRASATCTDSTSIAFGHIVAMRAADPHTACERLVYVHYHIMGCDWSDYVEPSRQNNDW